MRIGGLELRRRFADGAGHTRSLAALPAGVGPDLDTPGAASHGSDLPWPISVTGMRPTENPELQGRWKYAIYDDMRWSDPAVKSTLWIYKLPIRSARYVVDPASDDPVDVVVRDAVCWQFGLDGAEGELDWSWPGLVGQALLCLDYGAHGHEIVEGDPTTWTDADGDDHDVVPIARLAPRFASSIRYPDGIRTDPASGRISLVIQDVPDSTPIPGDQLMWHVLDREGTDWYGQSLLRAMYGSWRLKRALMIAAGIGWDRYAIGIPAVWYPRSGGPAKKAEAEAIARNFRLHERAWMVFEGKRSGGPGGTEQGWDIDVIGGSGTMQDPSGLIRLYDEQIFTAAMQHFMVLGRTSGGNRALGEALGEPFYLAAQALADDVVAEIRRTAVRRFVDRNFGPDVDLPRISASGIQTHDLGILATAIYDFAQAGLSFTDRDTQNDIRELLHLRELPEDLAQQLDLLPGAAGVAGPPPPPGTPVPQAEPGTAVSVSGHTRGGGIGVQPHTRALPSSGVRNAPPGSPPVPTDARASSIAQMGRREGDGLGYDR
jgi:hypothetical protein